VQFAIVEGIRFAAMGAISMIIIVGCLVMAITRPLWGRWLIFCGGLINMILWIAIGLHTTVGLVSSDLCYVLDETPKKFIVGPVSKFGVEWEEVKPYVDYFLYCNTSADPFSPILGGTHSLLDAVDRKLNESIAAHRPKHEIEVLTAHVAALAGLVDSIDELLTCVDVSQSLFTMKQAICTQVLTSNFFQLCCLFGMGLIFGIGIFITFLHTVRSSWRNRRLPSLEYIPLRNSV